MKQTYTHRSQKTLRSVLVMAIAAATLPGCAIINDTADGLWSGTQSVARFVSKPFRGDLRAAPDYRVVETSPYEGASVELYTDVGSTYSDPYEVSYVPPSPAYAAPSYSNSFTHSGADFAGSSYAPGQYFAGTDDVVVQKAQTAQADQLAFVALNGKSEMNDWNFCETVHRGYWMVDAAGGRINPEFEVCMRNKGYVLEEELALYGLNGETPLRASRSYAAPIDTPYVGGYRQLP